MDTPAGSTLDAPDDVSILRDGPLIRIEPRRVGPLVRKTRIPAAVDSTPARALPLASLHPDHPMTSPIGRRDFLLAMGAGVGAIALPGSRVSLPGAPQPIGLQLYTVRDLMQRDVEYTLRQVAGIGYREVEFAGLFDKEPKKVAGWLKKYGLTSPSSHIPLDRLTKNLQGVVDEVKTLGNDYVVCPWIDAPLRTDADAWRRIAATFNRVGDSLQRVGLRFAYHNHDFEFQPLAKGEIGYDILLAECDPKFVKMEMDLYWITKGGRDPLTYFAKWPNRFPLVHVKDMTGNGAITNVGQGRIDWSRIFAKRREAGIEHFFVENDSPMSPIDDIRISYEYLSRLGL
jgi:sugar phosphate isomerase/epimerase